jgi:hypothetical protein
MSSEALERRVGVEGIRTVLRRHRLRWFGHVEKKEDAIYNPGQNVWATPS